MNININIHERDASYTHPKDYSPRVIASDKSGLLGLDLSTKAAILNIYTKVTRFIRVIRVV